MKKYIYPALIVAFALVFLVSAVLLADYFIKSKKQQDQYDELSNLVQQGQQQQPSSTDPTDGGNASDATQPGSDDPDSTPAQPVTHVTVTNPNTGKPMKILREYAIIYQKNSDLVGWIKIDGTRVNYPVMQTPEWVNFYLTRDFYKKNSRHGAIYANESANINTPSDNVTLYGHRMADGSMFASLHNYSDIEFYKKYPYITFDTLTEHHTYQIMSVFRTTATLGEGFTYHTFVDGDEQSFAEYVRQCKELSFYETSVEATYGDKLLTLSTCDHSIENGRYVVVAKRIS